MTQLVLTPGLPAGLLVSGMDPAKDSMWTATIRSSAALWTAGGIVAALRAVEFECYSWTVPGHWELIRALFGDGGAMTRTGFVLCEAQWAGADAKEKWSGLQALCHTAGALRGAAASVGMMPTETVHWSRDSRSVRRGVPLARPARGLGFIEPSAWRKVALAPRSFSDRDTARRTEQRCCQQFFDRSINADFSAAFGILLCALGLNFSDLGVPI